MSKLEFRKYLTKNILIISSVLLHFLQISAIVYLFTTDESHTHDYDYADESHTHSAKEITYSSFQYGGYGSLQSKINEIDEKADEYHSHNEIDEKADEDHYH